MVQWDGTQGRQGVGPYVCQVGCQTLGSHASFSNKMKVSVWHRCQVNSDLKSIAALCLLEIRCQFIKICHCTSNYRWFCNMWCTKSLDPQQFLTLVLCMCPSRIVVLITCTLISWFQHKSILYINHKNSSNKEIYI